MLVYLCWRMMTGRLEEIEYSMHIPGHQGQSKYHQNRYTHHQAINTYYQGQYTYHQTLDAHHQGMDSYHQGL